MSDLRKTIVAVGRALYGARWQNKFAAMAGLSPAYISMVSSGERPTTPVIESAIVAGLEKEILALEERKKLIRKLIDKSAAVDLAGAEACLLLSALPNIPRSRG